MRFRFSNGLLENRAALDGDLVAIQPGLSGERNEEFDAIGFQFELAAPTFEALTTGLR